MPSEPDGTGDSDTTGPPDWVSNVKAPSRTPRARVARAIRRTHRLVTHGLVLGLPFLLTWSWLGSTGAATPFLRAVSTAAALVAAPIVLLIWVDPPTSLYMAAVRRGRWSPDRRRRTISHTFVPIARIARSMSLAVVVTEDAYFFWHVGFDPFEIVNAARYNWSRRAPGRNLRGASTITQQMTKNLFLPPAQSYVRKVVEAGLTALIEGLWTKRRILEVYLNIVELGDGVFGVEAAARRFFDKPAAELTTDEAALLAVSLRAPRLYRVDRPSPTMLKARAETRQRMSWCGEDMMEQLQRL